MIKTSIEKLASEIGFDIGASDDVTQANLLNGFCRALYDSIPNNHNREMQILYITDKLDKKSRTVIKELADYIRHKENDNEPRKD